MNLQSRYDLEVAGDEIAEKVARDVRPLVTVRGVKAGGIQPSIIRTTFKFYFKCRRADIFGEEKAPASEGRRYNGAGDCA